MEDTRGRWERAYVEALDYDTWGQVEEAVECYQRLQAAAAAEYVENVLGLPLNRRDAIGKLAAVLKLRVQELQTSDKNIGLNGMKNLKPYLKELIVTDAKFPRSDINADAILGVSPQDEEDQIKAVPPSAPLAALTMSDPSNSSAAGTLRGPPQNLSPGDATLTIYVEKWGLKDASKYCEPRVTVAVYDANGKLVEAVQETPTSTNIAIQHVFFDNTVYIQTPLNKLPTGAAIFFEFKHWKADKKKKSCKAYCFLEMDEIKSGPVTLEVYKKPPNYTRSRTPALLSMKPLYLHLDLAVQHR